MYKKKNIAVIGIGYWGIKIFNYLKKRNNYNIKYIYTRNKINIKNNTQNLQIIKNDNSVKEVFIITPIDTHYKLAKYFDNKVLFIEKPLSLEYKNSLKLLKKKKIFVDYLYRYSDSINKIKKIKENKTLGKLKNININISQIGRFNKFDVNYLLNSHALSILSIFTDIKKINYNVYPNFLNKGKVTDLNINFISKKINGNIFLSLNSIYKKFNLLFIFEKGSIELIKFENFSRLKISKYDRDIETKIKFKEFILDENNNLNYSINAFISKKSKSYNEENIKIAYVLEKIEKMIYKKKVFFDK